jgi:subtilisin family serine protease
MEEGYVVLRRSAGRNVRLRDGTGDSGAGTRIEVMDRISSHERRELEQEGSEFARIFPMYLHEPLSRRASPEPAAPASWGLEAVGVTNCAFDGSGITVAILDTGIDLSHPAFAGVRERIVVRDFTGDGDGDTDGHGTHCAGTLCGGTVDGTRIGVAPGLKKVLVGKVIGVGNGSTAPLLRAIHWAIEEGAQIISMSLGLDFPRRAEIYERRGDPKRLATSRALEEYCANVDMFRTLVESESMAAAARHSALLFVAASGNGSRRDERADYSIAATPPAAAKGMLSVGALERDAAGGVQVAPYSNAGVQLCAPGSGVLSANHKGGLAAMDGTSMAAPHVAGVAALWAQKLTQERGRLYAADWEMRLKGAATPVGGSGFELTGHGLVQAPQP